MNFYLRVRTRDDFLAELNLPADHNETVLKKFKEIEIEKEENRTATKP